MTAVAPATKTARRASSPARVIPPSRSLDPDFLAVWRKEGLMRRSADIGRMLDGIGGGIDEGHRIEADRNDRDRLLVRRETHPMHQDLALVEGAEVAGLGIAELDDAEKLVRGRVDDRHGI